ncbi:MAG: peptide-binding protein, partial [Anaerolineales bacterium]
MNRKIYATILIILAGICLIPQLSGAQILGFKIEGDRKKIKIPFELYNNLIVIPVVVNDRLPLRFVLDTGVRTTILTEKVYSQLLDLEY